MAARTRPDGPPTEPDRLAAWALSRIAAAAAEDAHVNAVIDLDRPARATEPNLGGRFHAHPLGRTTSRHQVPRLRFHLEGISSQRLRDEDSEEPWAALLDPARLIRGIGAVNEARWRGPWLELGLIPHPMFASPTDPWLPPGAQSLTVQLDPATGFLHSATLLDDLGPVATARVVELDLLQVSDPNPAGTVLARMARTLLEPARLTALIHIDADPCDDLFLAPLPSARSWTVSCDSARLTVTGDYEPDRTSPAAARLAELLAPARIVSHLARVTAASPNSVSATVRPFRTFPFSAWAPDETLTCRFTVDPTTGVLLHAEATAEHRLLLRHTVTALGPEQPDQPAG
ncbi:hypothetical protein [Streptomyces sp. NRRL WC-3742]|uniref:hypothetical protein n=1 Tax=Streptomyces sp. NRRL WC-3742 TaxID=1463934 RepID=UPI0004C54C0C|nr:hypothetical protein [Streptomyces sp. NRRL WC-3742]